ncbi:MAG: 50S ribosomal protein L22 [Candidatus Zixiibacteriota bacterium]
MVVQSTARLRYVSIPPRKMRLVANLVKGLPVESALNILNFTPKIAAQHIAKTLKSATANALSLEGTDHLKPENLVIKSITVDAAPTAKRVRFQSMGRVFRIRKRYCHLTVVLEGETDVVAEAKGKRIKAQRKSVQASKETVQKKTAEKKAVGKAAKAKVKKKES